MTIIITVPFIEFYYGYDYKINETTGEIEGLVKIPITDGHALSTYGWGNVQNRFPFSDYYFSKDGEDYFKLHYLGGSSLDNRYTVVWRLE